MKRSSKVPSMVGWFLLVVGTFFGGHERGVAADRHWLGEFGQFWMTAANWSNSVAPVAGDNLFFSGRPVNQFTINNFPAGTRFSTINVSPGNVAGFRLSGAPFVVTNGLVASGTPLSSGTTITADLSIDRGAGAGQDTLFTPFTVSRSLTISNLNLNRQNLVTHVSGSMTILGAVTADPEGGGGFVRLIMTNTGHLWIPSSARYLVSSVGVISGTLQFDAVATNVYAVAEGRPTRRASLSGTGTVATVNIEDDGILRPGATQPGIFRALEQLSLRTSGTLQVDLQGLLAGVEYDQVITSNLFLGGRVDVRMLYEAQVGDTYEIIRCEHVNFPHRFVNVPGRLFDTTNGYSLGVTYPTNGVLLKTVRRPDSPFVLWNGTSPDSRWTNANNWAAGVVPSSGSHVYFAGYGTNFGPLTNNLSADVSLASVLFTAGSHVIAGMPLTVTQGITNAVTGTNSCLGGLVVLGPLILHADAGGMLVVGGSFNGSGTIRKEGQGTLLYAGTTMNSFVGSVAVNAGAFRVDGSLTDGAFTINGGVLQGTGTVGAVTMNGGTLSPGTSAGIFHVEGNLAMASAATFKAELNGAVPGSGYDQLQVNGAVDLNGAALSLQPGFSAAQGTAFLILVNDGNDAITGTFAGLPEGAVFAAGGQDFTISYRAGSGSNDVLVTRTAPQTRLLPLMRVDGGTMRLQGTGSGGANYTIQANTNLAGTNWSNIGTVSADGGGAFQFLDTNVQQFPRRFYRTRLP